MANPCSRYHSDEAAAVASLPSDFVAHLLEDIARGRDDKRKFWHPDPRFSCDYHDHDEATPKGSSCGAREKVKRTKAEQAAARKLRGQR